MKELGMVIVAGGSSSRFGSRDKLLVELEGKPLFTHCIATFGKILPHENLILVTSEGRQQELAAIVEEHTGVKITAVAGGRERRDSSLNGLLALPELKYAGVHDAARPFISEEMIAEAWQCIEGHGSAVLARPVTDTIKVADDHGRVVNTPPRQTLFACETPKIFERQLLIDAYRNAPPSPPLTDEAMAMERAGHPVQLCIHSGDNRKITYSKDL